MAMDGPVRLTAERVLALSDAASHLSPARWSVALLRAGYPGLDEDAVHALTLGARDARIVAMRTLHLGERFEAEPDCAACGARMELSFDASDIGIGAFPVPEPGFREVEIDGHAARLRPVTVADILDLERERDPDNAVQRLSASVCDGSGDLSPASIAEALETLDPLADLWIGCDCPECGEGQSIAFDPVSFVARELRQMAGRVLADVVTIARAFHWSERDILALPAERRAYYVTEALA